MSEYAELPWSVEDTIENLKELKDIMKNKVIFQNLHGRGKKDAEEIDFDFGRAIEALKKQIPKKVFKVNIPKTNWSKKTIRYECPVCHKINHYHETDFCILCGQALDWNVD